MTDADANPLTTPAPAVIYGLHDAIPWPQATIIAMSELRGAGRSFSASSIANAIFPKRLDLCHSGRAS